MSYRLRRPRIALISSSFAPFVGGVEEHVRRVAAHLVDRGYDVEVWTVDRGTGPSVETVDGVVVRRIAAPLPARRPGSVLRFLTAVPRAWRRWAGAYRTFRPDILHVHCFGPNGVYALGLHRRFGTPLVVTSHGETMADDNSAYDRSALLVSALTRAIRRARAVTGPSTAVLKDLRDRFGLTGGRVVANGVDLSIEPRIAPTVHPYFFAVGRIGPWKGFDLLIRAFASADLPPDLRLVIGGDGPERESLGTLVDDLGLADRVQWRGWMDAQAVADAMASALAVVVPSRVEPFGIVALEAWRSKASLIMTSRGGASDFVEDGVSGLLVDPLDQRALVSALERTAGDPSLREELGNGGRERASGYSWERVVDDYARLYDDVESGD